MKKIKPYIISLLITLGTGILSGLIVSDADTIYAALEKPPFSPPASVFTIVWIILYILMAVSAGLVFSSGSSDRYEALRLYVMQLAANFLWPLIFFGTQKFFFALVWLVALWVLAALMAKKFFKISPLAGYMLIPYLVWLTFALYLNIGVYFLN